MLCCYLMLLETVREKSKFTRIYERYRDVMYLTAYGILHDDRLAEDAVHDAFLKIIDHLEKISETECHKTQNFVVIIVRNKAIDLYRKRRRQGEAPLEEGAAPPAGLPDTPAGELAERIAALPEKLRDALELRYDYGYSVKETARLLKISEEAARKRLERAKAALLEEYRKGGETIVR